MQRLTLVALVPLFVISQALDDILPHKSDQLEQSWQSFKSKFNKSYPNEVEEEKRKQIYSKALQFIAQHNSDEKNSYKMSVNFFSDLTLDEFKAQMNLKPSKYWNSTRVNQPNRGQANPLRSIYTPLRASVDWRNGGYVTKPLYQGMCGCCWAIAVVGAVESINAIKTGNLIEFSSQNIIDCATRPYYNSNGCQGGFLDEAFAYIMQNGVADAEKYPFRGYQTSACEYNLLPKEKNVPITGFRVIMNEVDLARAVAMGPVPVAIDADQLSFQMYSSGIYDDPFCSHNVNHAVLVVGYDANSWIIKNSWSQFWGENGYARIRRGKNMCGIVTQGLQPIF